MGSIFRGDDRGFNRFQHPAPPCAPPEQQYGAPTFSPRLQPPLGGICVMQQQQQLEQQQRPQQQQQHPAQQQQQARRMQPSTHHQQQQLRNVDQPSRKERGDFSRPHRTAGAGHDSNDDDGETSSASEDSALSAGYPSPPQATEAKPADSSFHSANNKRAEPSTAFTLPPSSQRSRIQLTQSEPAPLHAGSWLQGDTASFESGAPAGAGATGARQLPRLPALEELQPHQPLRKENQQRLRHEPHHHNNQERHRQQNQNHRRHELGSHVAPEAAAPTSRMMAAPMQLPALSEARALAKNRNTTSSPAAAAAAVSSASDSVSSSAAVSPGLRSSSSSPPRPTQHHQHQRRSSATNASTRQQQQQYHQQEHHQRRVSSPSPTSAAAAPHAAHLLETTSSSRYQLPVPAGMHTVVAENSGPSAGGATTTADHHHHHPHHHQRWLPSGERRQVPRIEALSSTEAVQPEATQLPAVRPSRQQWDAAVAWSKPTQDSSRGFDQTSSFSGGYCCESRPEEDGGCARHDARGRRERGWASREEEEWAASQGRGGGFQQHHHQQQREEIAQQPSSRVLRHPESASCRARSCSPLSASRQNGPVSPTATSAIMPGTRGHEAWAAAAAIATGDGSGGGGGGRHSWGMGEADGGGGGGAGGEWTMASSTEHQQRHHQLQQQQQQQQQHLQQQHHHRASGSDGKQILQRYLTNLYPKASREVWSHDEEEVLWRAQKEYGNAWSYISGLLPGRSENAVKNHWYTQMRMFIGQRGNHSASSKPCPPPSAKAPTKPPAASASNSSRQQPRPPHRKHDEERGFGDEHQLRRPAPIATVGAVGPYPMPTDAAAAAAAATANAAATAAAATAAAAAATAAAAAAAAAIAEAEAEAEAQVGRMAFVEDEEEHESQAEIEARADAVAALGMLFAQRSDSSMDEEEVPRKGDRHLVPHSSSSAPPAVGGGEGTRQREGTGDRRSPVFSVGVAGRA